MGIIDKVRGLPTPLFMLHFFQRCYSCSAWESFLEAD